MTTATVWASLDEARQTLIVMARDADDNFERSRLAEAHQLVDRAISELLMAEIHRSAAVNR